MSSGTCAACGRSIDAAAKMCPYCGADTATGERIDTQAILQEVFHSRELSTGESVMEFARQRQGIVIAGGLLLAFVVLAGIHQFVNARNATAVTNSPAVPLTEITDIANQKNQTTPVPMPEDLLTFPYEGRPETWRTFIVERGAVAPAPPAPATTTGGAVPAPGAGVNPANPANPNPAAGAAAAPRPTPQTAPRPVTPPPPVRR